MTDDPDAALGARRRKCVDRALEAVERMLLAVLDELERLVIVVAASLAPRHGFDPPSPRSLSPQLATDSEACRLARLLPAASRRIPSRPSGDFAPLELSDR